MAMSSKAGHPTSENVMKKMLRVKAINDISYTFKTYNT